MVLRTFFVEDNVTIRDNLIETLNELVDIRVQGFAETEQAAVAWLKQNSTEWDLAVVDLFLLEGSGLGVLETCKKRSSNQKMVVLSNYATNDVRQRCKDFGADQVFDKSNEIDIFLDYCMELGG